MDGRLKRSARHLETIRQCVSCGVNYLKSKLASRGLMERRMAARVVSAYRSVVRQHEAEHPPRRRPHRPLPALRPVLALTPPALTRTNHCRARGRRGGVERAPETAMNSHAFQTRETAAMWKASLYLTGPAAAPGAGRLRAKPQPRAAAGSADPAPPVSPAPAEPAPAYYPSHNHSFS